MYALFAMAVSLVFLVILLRFKVKIGRCMGVAAGVLILMLGVSPGMLGAELAEEWQSKPLTQTTGYLALSLSALLFLVNVIGEVMQETGIAKRLVPAMQGLFRSRRAALAAIPMLMGMLPTPGGIMLSAPMVREMGDFVGVERSRLAAINFYFRHQWESVWPLFPAVPLVQGILGVSAGAVLSHNILISGFGIIAGAVFLLAVGFPKKSSEKVTHAPVHHNLRSFAEAFWPILFTAILYALFNWPPAVGLGVAIAVLMLAYRVPGGRCRSIFRKGFEPDFILLVVSALLFKLTLQASGAVENVVAFFEDANLPPRVIIFFLPFMVASLIGVTMATVAITFPFLLPYIGTGDGANMYLGMLAFCGLMCGLFVTPVHLCLPLSAGYFKTSLTGIILKTAVPAIFMGAACAAAAWWLG